MYEVNSAKTKMESVLIKNILSRTLQKKIKTAGKAK